MPQGVEYAIRYYRDQFWTDRFARVGISKPAGWVVSEYKSADRSKTQACIDAINRQWPTHPAELVTLVNGLERD